MSSFPEIAFSQSRSNSRSEFVLLSFEQAQRQKRGIQPCIFCGHTQRTHRFKGKSVCLGCLKRILKLFPSDLSTFS